MARTKKPDASVTEVMAQVAADSPRLRARAERMMDLVFDDVEKTFKIGTPQDKAAFVKAIVPHMLRSMQDSQADAAALEQRAAAQRILTMLRGGDGPTEAA